MPSRPLPRRKMRQKILRHRSEREGRIRLKECYTGSAQVSTDKELQRPALSTPVTDPVRVRILDFSVVQCIYYIILVEY